jgi:GrpB-like predicted nucleotidyltransferase (UPF0157 family)
VTPRSSACTRPAGSSCPAIDEEVTLVPYDRQWPLLFEAERARLQDRFAQLLRVEHFGSTAIADMPAKPIIDILAGVESMAVADALFESIVAFGYQTSREFNAMLPDRRWFMRVTDGRRTHHLHVVQSGAAQWLERLRFRDVLRSNAELARRYGELKRVLAVEHRHDREAYTVAKSEFVASVVALS